MFGQAIDLEIDVNLSKEVWKWKLKVGWSGRADGKRNCRGRPHFWIRCPDEDVTMERSEGRLRIVTDFVSVFKKEK
jgi:hypothetical protein